MATTTPTTKAIRVGLAVGHGTGDELCSVFERAIAALAAHYSTTVHLFKSPRTYHSYFSLKEYFSSDPSIIHNQSAQDVEHYVEFAKAAVAAGCPVIFRTAINAQSLYMARERLEAVKLEYFQSGPNNEMLLVRDQAQGFYAGTNEHDVARGLVTRQSVFSKEVMGRMLGFALSKAEERWGGKNGGLDKVLLVYKFHLLDGVLSAWARDWSEEYGVRVDIAQPDTANRNLLVYGIQGKQLVLSGNEWGDIMHVILLSMFGRVSQEERCTENVYLHPSVRPLSEYQTVHGSADDIAGQGVVNPSATLRAAAAILDKNAGCRGAIADMERALDALKKNGVGSKDQGRPKSIGTDEFANTVIDSITSNKNTIEAARL